MPSWTAYSRSGFVLGHIEAEDVDLGRRKADARWPNEVAVLVESHWTERAPRRPRHGVRDRQQRHR